MNTLLASVAVSLVGVGIVAGCGKSEDKTVTSGRPPAQPYKAVQTPATVTQGGTTAAPSVGTQSNVAATPAGTSGEARPAMPAPVKPQPGKPGAVRPNFPTLDLKD